MIRSRISHPWLSFVLVSIGVFLSTLDSSMVNVALPSIMRTFGTTLTQTGWVAVMYLLTITVTLLLWGRFADRCGFERIYLFGMFIFGVGAAACFFAPSLPLLVCCRFIQATGASMMMSSGPAIMKRVFPVERLGRMLGLIGVATSCGLMVGPVVSGLLIRYFSWRALFLVPVPISLAGFVLGWVLMRGRAVPPGAGNTEPFDWAGFALWAATISLLVLVSSYHAHLTFMMVSGGGLVVLLLLIAFVLVEQRVAVPLLPRTLLCKRPYVIALLCAAISFTVLFVALILLPFYLDYVLHLPVDRIGLVMMAVPMAVLLVSPMAGRLHDRVGAGYLTIAGLGICALALVCLCFLNEHSTEIAVAWRMALLGAGQALFLSPNSASVLATVEQRYVGVASGMLATARNLGMLAGVTLAGIVFSRAFSLLSGGNELLDYDPGQVHIFLFSLQISYGSAAGLAVFGAVLSAGRLERKGGAVKK